MLYHLWAMAVQPSPHVFLCLELSKRYGASSITCQLSFLLLRAAACCCFHRPPLMQSGGFDGNIRWIPWLPINWEFPLSRLDQVGLEQLN